MQNFSTFPIPLMRADDTRLSMEVNNNNDAEKMQCDLEKVYNWAAVNNMCFNSEIFELLTYKVTDVQEVHYMTPQGNTVQNVEHLKDLGITMHCSAVFEMQMDHADKSSSTVANWVLRVFETRDPVFMPTLLQKHGGPGYWILQSIMVATYIGWNKKPQIFSKKRFRQSSRIRPLGLLVGISFAK